MPMEGHNEQAVSGFAHTELTTVLTFGFSVLKPTVGLSTEKQNGSNVGIQWAAHCWAQYRCEMWGTYGPCTEAQVGQPCIFFKLSNSGAKSGKRYWTSVHGNLNNLLVEKQPISELFVSHLHLSV